jgi:hypothetical protein
MTHLADAPDEVEREHLLPDGREIRGPCEEVTETPNGQSRAG